MNKNKFECESCGRILSKNSVKEKEPVDEYWQSSKGRKICGSCIFYPLEVLNELYNATTIPRVRKIIEEFDDEFEESFLEHRREK